MVQCLDAVAPERSSGDRIVTEACFAAATRHGSVRLAALNIQAPRHAAEAAIAFARFAGVVTAIETWAGEAFNWRWATRPSLPLGATAMFGTNAHTPCRIEFPLPLLRALPAPPDTFAARLQWDSVPIVLAIAGLDLSDAELDHIEPGGAVVLPASLDPDWRGTVRGADEPVACGLVVALGAAPRISVQVLTAAAVPAVSSAYEVRLNDCASLPADQLVGWSEFSLRDLSTDASLWRTGGIQADCLAKGRLMPWGSGWALAIESVCTPAGISGDSGRALHKR